MYIIHDYYVLATGGVDNRLAHLALPIRLAYSLRSSGVVLAQRLLEPFLPIAL